MRGSAHVEDRQQGLGLSVITEGLIEMDKQVAIAGSKDETRAKLKRVAAEAVLLVTGGSSASARFSVVASEDVEQVPRFHFRRLVRLAVRIDKQWESDSRFFAEQLGISHVTETNRRQSGTRLPEFVLVFAQLRDVFAAEDSAVMPKEHEHARVPLPNRPEANVTTARFQ